MIKNSKKNILVIGSGFAGLSTAAILARQGQRVILHEKNSSLGGRASTFSEKNFLFDMGPSWYWMPEVFERYYQLFGYTTSDFYELKKLDPAFRIIFGKNDFFDIPSNFDSICVLFDNIESGAGNRLREFIKGAEFKYRVGMENLIYKPGHSLFEFINGDVLSGIFRLQVFTSFSNHVRKYFRDPRLLALMEFPVLFLGAKPADTPALYSLMNYACFKLGTWYPMGGFGKIIEAFTKIAIEEGVELYPNSSINELNIVNDKVKEFTYGNTRVPIDAVVGAADYHHIERELLPFSHRSYSEKYWDSRTFAPSALIFYLGIKGKVENLQHHNLFFDASFERHANEIYADQKWPQSPLFYVCCPSKTDKSVAPEGDENIFILMPIAPGLADAEDTREKYFDIIITRIEKFTGVKIRENIIVKKSYSVSDFSRDYNAYKGNAYGLANTLMQTAMFKPKVKSKKIDNLFFSGQLTVPGPGVPPSIISGQITANEVLKYLKS